MDGILNIHKEIGYTSHDVVAKLRGICRQKKIGHTGTLDPDATGVLPVCLGKATKVCEYLTDRDKSYEAVVLLGVTTDTQDISGKVISEKPVAVSEERLRQVICSFIGDIEQVPPMYSALKVQGKKLYELARQGIEVERKPRKITICGIDNIGINLDANEFSMTVHCSKGTYIRTLSHDIGEMLGCGAAMKSLIRIKAGSFSIEESLLLSEVEKRAEEGTLESSLLKIEDVFSDFPKGNVIKEADKFLINGNVLYPEQVACDRECSKNERIRIYNSKGEFKAIYEYLGSDAGYKTIKMF